MTKNCTIIIKVDKNTKEKVLEKLKLIPYASDTSKYIRWLIGLDLEYDMSNMLMDVLIAKHAKIVLGDLLLNKVIRESEAEYKRLYGIKPKFDYGREEKKHV